MFLIVDFLWGPQVVREGLPEQKNPSAMVQSLALGSGRLSRGCVQGPEEWGVPLGIGGMCSKPVGRFEDGGDMIGFTHLRINVGWVSEDSMGVFVEGV